MRERYPQLRWRALVVLMGICFAVLFLRLGWVQVVRAPKWKEWAAAASTEERSIPALRGRILDRRGQVLARTEILTTVGVSRPGPWLEEGLAEKVSRLIGIPEAQLRSRLRGRDAHTVLARDLALDPDVREQLRNLPWMSVDDTARRIRPHGRLAHHLLGIVSRAGEGISGLERIHEDVLAGRDGVQILRQDAGENLRSRLVPVQPVDGADLTTTLDLRVQSILERELNSARESSGAYAAQGIVMEVATGEVLAMAQAPYATPAADGSAGADRWRVMAATDQFEPGSVFKIFTLATLLAESVVDTSTVFDGHGKPGEWRSSHLFPNGRRIQDVHPVGRVSMRHAFVTSSNIIFATAVQERLRTVEVHDAIRRFGFMERTGSGFAAEADGQLLAPEQWSSYMMQSLAMGQGISVTLLQLATASAAVFGDGDLHSPLFAREIVDAEGRTTRLASTVRRRDVVPARVRTKVRAAARDVVHADYGTAKNARVEGLSVAGKTSTAQVSTRDGYIDGIYTPIFVGAVPAGDPRLVVIIVLHGAPGEATYGGNTAAPCFSRVVGEIAARTPWLESAFEIAEIPPAVSMPAPELVGLTVEEIRAMSEGASWRVDLPALPDGARAVGQLPAPRARIAPGTRLQLAWSGARQ